MVGFISKAYILGLRWGEVLLPANAGELALRGAVSDAGSSVADGNEFGKCLPFRARQELVEVWFALFAEILVGAGSFIHDADATAVLPDLADVALDE